MMPLPVRRRLLLGAAWTAVACAPVKVPAMQPGHAPSLRRR